MADEPVEQPAPTTEAAARPSHRAVRLRPEDLDVLQAMHDRSHPGDPWRYFLTEDGQLGLRNEKTGEVLGGIDQPWRSRPDNSPHPGEPKR